MTDPAFIGDLLITFDKESIPAVKRQASLPWKILKEGQPFTLWHQSGGAQWKGFPFKRIQNPEWDIFFLGEIFGTPIPVETLLKDIVIGKRSADLLNGHCLLIACHEKEHKWHAWTNRLGTLHIYLGNFKGKLTLGTFLPAVAGMGSSKELDWMGLSSFFRFGFFPGDVTFFRDVRVIPPASHIIFDDQGTMLHETHYWHWHYQPDESRSYDETVDQFKDVFHHIISQQSAQGRIGLPISGGLDSRCLAGGMNNEKLARPAECIWAFSYGYQDNSTETRIAQKVADKCGLPFDRFTIRPYLFENLRQIMASLEGFNDLTMCRQAFVLDEMRQNSDFILGGHLGDLVLNDAGLPGERSQGFKVEKLADFLVHKLERPGSEWLLNNLVIHYIPPDQASRLHQELFQSELDSNKEIEDLDFRSKVFKMQQYCFRFTATGFRMYQSVAYPRLPFYDDRLIDLICTIPTAFLRGRRLQIDYLKRYAPDLAKVPWQAADANLYHYHQFNTWLLPKRAIKKAWRIITGQKVIQRNWEVQFLNPAGRDGLHQWLLERGLKLHALVPQKAVAQLVEDFYRAPSAGNGYTLSMLLTFSAWLELYG